MTGATWLPFTGDNLTCTCGNTTDSDGFYTCDTDRGWIEPTLDSGWDGLYCCGRCGQGYRLAGDDRDTTDYDNAHRCRSCGVTGGGVENYICYECWFNDQAGKDGDV